MHYNVEKITFCALSFLACRERGSERRGWRAREAGKRGGEERKTDELLTWRLGPWNSLARLQALLMKKSAPCSVLASPLPATLGSACSLPLPSSASSSSPCDCLLRYCLSASINKTSQCIRLSKALCNDNIYRGSNKICIERLIVNMQ